MPPSKTADDVWYSQVASVVGRASIWIIAFVCLLYSIASFFGLDLFWPMRPAGLGIQEIADWNDQKQNSLLFALVALMGLYVSTTLVTKFETIISDLARLEQSNKELFSRLSLRLDEQLDRVHGDLNPILKKVVGNYVSEMANSLRTAINDRSIVIRDLNEFRVFYRRALKAFPDSDILATSLASKEYFWSDPSINDAIKDFLEKGGKMSRIFMLQGVGDLNEPEIREILNGQRRIGVDVYVALKNKLPEELQRLFVVDRKHPIAWEVQTSPGENRIRDITARVDTAHIADFRDRFERLLLNPSVKKYTPQLAAL
jgi:hypothetical protein